MEANPNEHINAAELAKLLEESRQRTQSALNMSAPNIVDTHPHLATCTTCRQQFDDLSSVDRQLDRQLKGRNGAEPALRQVDCPRAEVWREISGGSTSPDETLAYVEHASRCDRCGSLLRAAVAEFINLNGEMTEAERGYIATLASAQAEWQQSLARRITGTPPARLRRESGPWWQKWLSAPRLAMAGAALLAVVGVGSWVTIHRNQPAAADRLLGRAYTEKRTLELRIAGADYAPLRISLGPEASFTGRPPALLKAEAMIAAQLVSHPSDPSWLQAKAQADVLEGKYDAAIEALRRALELAPQSPALQIDLATAYFERAQQEDRKEDFGAAYEYLSQALKLSPDDPVALFNRAIVAEHQFLYQQALDDWKHYLRVDTNTQWAEEARNRANAVQEKLKAHESKATPLLSPSQIAAMANSADLGSEVDQRIEEYLHEAVRSWIPQAFAENKANADPNASQALFFLADLTSQRHGDQWLSDLLRGSSSPHFRQAINALTRAVQANDAASYDVSRQQAELAERLFRASSNPAGVQRAQFEQIFAAQLTKRGEDCQQQSVAAAAESRRYSYPWIQIQLGLEESVCSALMGDLGAYDKDARIALDRAQQAGYGALYLRALGFLADNKLEVGDLAGSWKLVYSGLDRYWSGQFPPMRGYNLYTQGASAADTAGRPNLQLAILREAAAMIDADGNLPLRAFAHRTMAKAAMLSHQLPELAEQQYAETARLYALVPQNEAVRAFRIETEIRTAQLEVRQSRFDGALSHLARVQGEVQKLSDNYLLQLFYSTLGEVQLRSHHGAEAEQAFHPALYLAEQNLASLTSEASRASWSKDAAPVYLGLAEAELVQGREQESLDVFEWYLGAPQRVGKRRQARSQIPEAVQSLPDPAQVTGRLPLLSNQTVLAYGVLPDGLAIWVYDNRGVSAKWIPKSPQELQDLTANFYAQCSDPSSEPSALRRNSQTLYSLLIAPVEQGLDPKRTLVIESEGFLARLPFEALMDANGHYLIEHGPIVHSPGLYAETTMHPETPVSSDVSVLVVGSGASSPDAGLFALPNVAAGADKVASSFRSPLVLKGREATLNAVTKALPAATVFHFAGHAITTANDTGLMLEGKDPRNDPPLLLDATALRKLDLRNLQLAVLAACSTDSGEGGSRGFDSIAETLQTSGVPRVVASRWAVDSVEANAFANSFYRSLLSGQPVSNATRLTSLTVLLNSSTVHPYYWAAFAAYGRP
ncbi:MAG TPA: CHAT domain-containing protein [Terriglobales bacterium]|nr:CHAT domain-containing protein [Terriglobales bacterium]